MNGIKHTSPKILSTTWGKMEIESLGSGKDFKLWPGGGRAWNWNETGTQHSPGIQVADIKELLEHGAQIVILSKGRYSRLQTQQETLSFLENSGIKTIVAETKKAVQIYNDFAERNTKVAGLFHTTC